jgi:DNA modification methylase
MNEAYNVDCLEYMRSLPDNAFDLLIADPPYGGGFTEGGGCKGWFSKYHQNLEENQKRELGAHFVGRGRSKRYAEIYENDDCSQSVQVERERERERERAAV